jgi:very-short-patch-repair endonuclease
MHKLHSLDTLKSSRQRLRNALTPAEAALWTALQRSKLAGRKFRRQHSIGPYVVDFYCASERLVVELDGAVHNGGKQAARDLARTRFLSSLGLHVVRIENREIFENPDGVLALIAQCFRTAP